MCYELDRLVMTGGITYKAESLGTLNTEKQARKAYEHWRRDNPRWNMRIVRVERELIFKDYMTAREAVRAAEESGNAKD